MTTTGDLRELVELQDFVEVPDGFGGFQQAWVAIFTEPARIQILRGTETVMAGRLAGTQTLAITVRYQPGIAAMTSEWRVVDARSGVIYNIRSVEPDERRAWVNLLCESGVP